MSTKRRIVCAAIKNTNTNEVVIGVRHYCPIMRVNLKAILRQSVISRKHIPSEWVQGFIDNKGIFLDRKQSLEIAEQAEQLNIHRPKTDPEDELFSEDLY